MRSVPGGAHILLSLGAFLFSTKTSPRFDDVWNVVCAMAEDARRREEITVVECILAIAEEETRVQVVREDFVLCSGTVILGLHILDMQNPRKELAENRTNGCAHKETRNRTIK